jgi:hypothetical protein
MNWKGSGHGLFESSVPEFAWMDGGDMKNFSHKASLCTRNET